jgi:hypothetical protein
MGRGHADGVMAVDPVGLSALLRLTGPVVVPGWPVPITADNAVDVTLRQAYDVFGADPSRADFLGDVTHQVVSRATLGSPAHIARLLDAAAKNGHIIRFLCGRTRRPSPVSWVLPGRFRRCARTRSW